MRGRAGGGRSRTPFARTLGRGFEGSESFAPSLERRARPAECSDLRRAAGVSSPAASARGGAVVGLMVLVGFAGLGCRQDMHDQPRFKPLAKSDFFADGRASRPPVAGTVARGQLREDAWLYTGMSGGALAAELPVALDAELLQRGRERYQIFCTPCHGQTGRGDGIVVRRGYRKAASFHSERLRGEPVGYFFDTMTRGFGAMPDYAAQIPVRDRWAIAAYVKALQLSQYADASRLSPEQQRQLRAQPAEAHK